MIDTAPGPLPFPTSELTTPKIGDTALDFSARTTSGPLSLSDWRGQWIVFFSHPADFTPVCTSEFIAFAKAAPRFAALGASLLGLSVDSLSSHLAWIEAIRTSFGVQISFPIIEDPSMAIAHAYGMLDGNAQDSATVRATYIIDPDGIIQAIFWYPMTVGRSVEEILRTLAALQRVAEGDALVPEGWRAGDPVLWPAAQSFDDLAAHDPAPPDPSRTGRAWFHRLREDGKR